MGIEYCISFPPEKIDELRKTMLIFGGKCGENANRFEFRFGPPDEKWADATVVLDWEGGIYFCDHCGNREKVSVLFHRIISKALTYSDSSDSIVVKEL